MTPDHHLTNAHKVSQGLSWENMWVIHHQSLQTTPSTGLGANESPESFSDTGAAEPTGKKAAGEARGFRCCSKVPGVWASESIKSLTERRLDGRTGCLLCLESHPGQENEDAEIQGVLVE